jgi:hypothetical protein
MVRGNIFSAKYVLLVLTDIFMWGKGGLRWRENIERMASSSLDNIWTEPDSQDLYWTNGKRPFTLGLV